MAQWHLGNSISFYFLFSSIKKKVKGGTPSGSGNNCKTLPGPGQVPLQNMPAQPLKFTKEAPAEPISSAVVKYNYQAQQLDASDSNVHVRNKFLPGLGCVFP